MSHFGSILCSLTCLPSTPLSQVLILSSLIHLLNFFSELTPDIELAQNAPAFANSNQSSIFDDGPEPTPDTPYRQASTDSLWQEAKNDELQALEKTHTWNYVDLPHSKRPIGCKRIYKIKIHSDSTMSIIRLERILARICTHDIALFTRHTPQGTILLLLFVDDMIIIGNVIHRYLMSQAKYAFDFLLRSGIIDSNTTSMPLDPNVHLTPYDGVPLEDFMTAPRTIHFTFVLHILRYIKGTLGHGLQFSSQSSLVLSGYFDVDWPGDPIDRGTTIGYCFYLGDSLISWHSKKKSVVSCSSTEPKYNALVDTTVELLWLCWLIANMGAPQ
ncbi:putative mitochondrial protein [Cucumis melo var. makuwa]|uniref:Mitochondrial protein n=1 Tax=Cucumis melo var. makuwa TaxID=1194695 RepID=A0A5A7SQ70_CUCMM|nr:putative mitochondrial protein [Cucumis melo var. makuwa]